MPTELIGPTPMAPINGASFLLNPLRGVWVMGRPKHKPIYRSWLARLFRRPSYYEVTYSFYHIASKGSSNEQ